MIVAERFVGSATEQDRQSQHDPYRPASARKRHDEREEQRVRQRIARGSEQRRQVKNLLGRVSSAGNPAADARSRWDRLRRSPDTRRCAVPGRFRTRYREWENRRQNSGHGSEDRSRGADDATAAPTRSASMAQATAGYSRG